MILYQIQCQDSKLWYRHGPNGGTWIISRKDASAWLTKDGIPSALYSISKAQAKCGLQPVRDPIIREFKPFLALHILRDLYAVRDLGDYCYDIRKREGEGWQGEQVCRWGDACARARNLLRKEL